MQLGDYVHELAKRRGATADAKLVVVKLMQEFSARPEVAGANLVLETAVKLEKESYDNLAAASVGVFKLNQDKEPHPAVSIKEMNVYKYDPEKVRQWCLGNFTMALKLDTKMIEKPEVAEKIPEVVVTKEPKAYIDTNLTKWEADNVGETVSPTA